MSWVMRMTVTPISFGHPRRADSGTRQPVRSSRWSAPVGRRAGCCGPGWGTRSSCRIVTCVGGDSRGVETWSRAFRYVGIAGLGIIQQSRGNYMSNNQGVGSTPPSRRSVVKGAAWAVPAVVVAGAAPTVAASPPGLAFTGRGVQAPRQFVLPVQGLCVGAYGDEQSRRAVGNTVTVVSDVAVNGEPTGVPGRHQEHHPCRNLQLYCCPSAGGNGCNSSCTPDGTTQRIFIFARAPVGQPECKHDAELRHVRVHRLHDAGPD